LIWTQFVKRSPSDIRRLAQVPPGRNAKGIALFALAQIAHHRRTKTADSESMARMLLTDLLCMKTRGIDIAWGYNFDWQSRNFFAPAGSPTIVPTAFAARAFIEAAREFNDESYIGIAHGACQFIIMGLPVTYSNSKDGELCYGYSPNDDTQIFNASLLAGEVLAEVGATTLDHGLQHRAEMIARYVVNHQGSDGAWTYGTGRAQQWVDNFHTAYVLYSLNRIIKTCSLGNEFQESLRRGYDYWKKTFFLADGWPKYYDDDPYPADTHASASAIVTFLELGELDPDSLEMAKKVARWTIRNLRDKRGYFYYQKRRFYTVRKPYMRWSQAWMLYALARLLESEPGTQ
jgi:hypothetical protein